MREYENFFAFMQNYDSLVNDMLVYEENKHVALISADPQKIDKAICEQQVGIKRLEKIEKEREIFQEEIGLGSMTFRQIVESMQGMEKEKFKSLFDNLQRKVGAIRESNLSSMAFAKKNLDLLNLYVVGDLPDIEQNYEASANRQIKRTPQNRPSVFETKI